MRRYVCLKCGCNWEVEAYREENASSSAEEEKFAGRPQILKGDIVRFISALTGEENVDVVRCENTEVYFNSAFGKVLAVYRFDGRDFNCNWDREEVKLRREFLEMMHEAVEDFERNVKTAGADMPKRMREAFTNSMVLKKRIKVKPRDIDNKDKYYGAAALCPICGTNIREEEESRPLLLCCLTIPLKVLYVATRKKVTFFCPMCGCSWSVKQCKRDEMSE